MNAWLGNLPPPTENQPGLPSLRPRSMGPHIGVIKPRCLDEAAQFRWKGEDWFQRCVLAKKAAKKKTSVVWYYGEEVAKAQDPNSPYYYCYLCEEASVEAPSIQINNGTDAALTHLEEKHNINRHSGVRVTPTATSNNDATSISNSDIGSSFRRGFAVLSGQFTEFKQLLIQWIVYCHIAFFQVENEYFRRLLFMCWPGLEKVLPKAAQTIRGWVIEAFESRKAAIRQEMLAAHSNIHISFDLWSSSNHKAIVGVIAHFINANGRRRNIVLGLREIEGEHSGENIGHQLLQLFKEYGLLTPNRLGYFICDNAETNDKCIAYLLRKVNPRISKRQIARRRIRCLGHIINLCAQAFIIGKDAENVCKELDHANRDGDWKKVGDLWRERGSIGRLHNIIRYIRATPQRRNRFKNILLDGELTKFNGLQVS